MLNRLDITQTNRLRNEYDELSERLGVKKNPRDDFIKEKVLKKKKKK